MADIVDLIVLAVFILNLIAFAVYGIDKRRARNNSWRISESTLLSVAALAPWGSLIGMYTFRHKTLKRKFKLVWLFAVLDLVLIISIVAALR